jgi:transcriptional regulator with XRE-family HTH domain
MTRGLLDDIIEQWHNDPDYLTEKLKLSLMEQISSIMRAKSISRSELARRLGSSRAYVTRLLDGSANMTIETLTRLSLALGCRLTIELREETHQSRNADVIDLPRSQHHDTLKVRGIHDVPGR